MVHSKNCYFQRIKYKYYNWYFSDFAKIVIFTLKIFASKTLTSYFGWYFRLVGVLDAVQANNPFRKT